MIVLCNIEFNGILIALFCTINILVVSRPLLSHDELMSLNGLYADMWNQQLETANASQADEGAAAPATSDVKTDIGTAEHAEGGAPKTTNVSAPDRGTAPSFTTDEGLSHVVISNDLVKNNSNVTRPV